MDDLFNPLVELTGASLDQIKLIFCLLASYPLGSIFVRLPRTQPAMKHLFSLAVSAFFLLAVMNLWLGTLQLLVSVLGTYVLALTLPGKNMPWIVFAFVMGHLTINHAYRAIYEISFDEFEITAPQMVLTMKLTTFAWNVRDGRCPAEQLDKWQLNYRIVIMPSLLEFLGYAFYFPGILVGPYTEYATYASLIDGSLFEPAAGQQPATSQVRFIPRGRKRVAYSRMLSGLAFLGLYVIFGGTFSYETVINDAWLMKGFLNRLFTVQILGFIARTKYYAVWQLTEGSSILTGLGFTGYTSSGNSRWEGATNVNIPLIEWAPNFKVLLDSWNIKTNVWLRETIYKRVARQGKKPGFKSSMITFLTSAFWHGIAGGYYLTFILGGFVTTVGRLCRAHIRPLFLPPILPSISSANLQHPQTNVRKQESQGSQRTIAKRLYDMAGSLTAVMILNFTVAPFVIGDFYDSLEAWRRMDWYGLWMIFGSLVFFFAGGKAWLQSLIRRRVRKAERRREEETLGVRVFHPNTPGPLVVPPVDLAVAEAERIG